MGSQPPVVEADQLDAAAAEIAHEAVGIGNPRDDARGRRAAPPPSPRECAPARRQRLRTVSVNSTPLTASRTAAVASMSSRATPHGLGQAHEAAEVDHGRFDALLVQPAVAAEPAAEAAEHLLVEQQQRGARQAVEDDETDRIRSDIDDADAPFPRASWPRARRRRASLPHSRGCAAAKRRSCHAPSGLLEIEQRRLLGFLERAAAAREARVGHEIGMGAEGAGLRRYRGHSGRRGPAPSSAPCP